MLLDNDVIVCACPPGKSLMRDGKTCLGKYVLRSYIALNFFYFLIKIPAQLQSLN